MNILLFFTAVIIGLSVNPLYKFLYNKYVIKKSEKMNTYNIKFKITFTSTPSLFDVEQKAKVTKTSVIDIKISAKDNDDALDMLNDILHQEVGYELTSIDQIDE